MGVADELTRLLQAKSDLATSITNKGVTVPASATLDDYPALVDQIQQGGTPVLPYDSKIEYLEATGTQYIDTGILFQVGMTILINAIYTGNYTNTQILVAPGVSAGQWFGNGWYSNKGRFGLAANNNIGPSDVRTSIMLNYYAGRSNSYANDTFKYVTRNADPTSNTIQIFGYGGNFLSSAKVYSCQIHDADNNTLADFIPVRKGTVGYLYDRISKILFGNIGTGDFVLGNDII